MGLTKGPKFVGIVALALDPPFSVFSASCDLEDNSRPWERELETAYVHSYTIMIYIYIICALYLYLSLHIDTHSLLFPLPAIETGLCFYLWGCGKAGLRKEP